MGLKKRIVFGVVLGAFLGLFCILGIGFRLGFEGNELLLISAWYNRVLMGFLVATTGNLYITKGWINSILRGGFIGMFVSLAWFISTAFIDPLGFIAGIVYGVVIDIVLTRAEP
jgi:hypothetical protein